MIIRKYKFKNGNVREQRIAANKGSCLDKVLKIGTMTEEIFIPDELVHALRRWKAAQGK